MSTVPGLFDRFSGWEQIGRGACGTVYRAHDAVTGRAVAVKVLRMGLGDGQAVGRFRREAAAMASVHHPGVVGIDDVIESDDEMAIVMELVEGVTAQSLAGRMSPSQSLAVLDQLGDPLDAVHAVGVVHRDLKPANVLIDRSGRCRIADFGVARFIAESIHSPGRNVVRTRTGVAIGTPAYISPEIAAGRRVDHRADVYSLGVLAYQLLVGRLPFEGGVYELLESHVSAAVPPPADFVPAFPSALSEVLLTALEKDPDHRPDHAGEFVTDLVAAAPDSWRSSGPGDLGALITTSAADNRRPATTTLGPGSRPPIPSAEAVPVRLRAARRVSPVLAVVATALAAAALGIVIVLAILH